MNFCFLLSARLVLFAAREIPWVFNGVLDGWGDGSGVNSGRQCRRKEITEMSVMMGYFGYLKSAELKKKLIINKWPLGQFRDFHLDEA